MDEHAVKKLLKDGYEAAGFDVVDETPEGETLLRFPQPPARDVTLKITPDDVQEYAEMVEATSEFRTVRTVGMANDRFREHLLMPLDPSLDESDLRERVIHREGPNDIYAELDRVSPVYANYFRFEPGYMHLCLDRLFALAERARRSNDGEALDVRSLFARPPAIRVFNLEAPSIEQAIRLSDEVIANSLFTLAYEYEIPLMLADKWPSSRYGRRQRLRHGDVKAFTISDADFPTELARLYQAGIGAVIPAHRFLAFFQILEHFFQEVDYARVYDELFTLLSSEDFRPDYPRLGQVIHLVEGYRSGLTTADLLEQLLWTHVGNPVLQQQIDANAGHVEETITGLAHRLTVTRDAIVQAGTNPVPVDSPSIVRDVPLVKFLAEQVILAARGE